MDVMKKFEVNNSKRLQKNSFEEIHLDRTKSSEMDVKKTGRWKLDNSGGWRSYGGFSITSESFPKFSNRIYHILSFS